MRNRVGVPVPSGCDRRWLRLGLLLLVTVTSGCTSSGTAASSEKAEIAQAASGEAPAGSWRHIAEPPIAPAGGMASAWTGRYLLVWGGQAVHKEAADGGAAYDPAADRWEVLPPAPIGARFGASALWTGQEFVVWGGQDGSGLTFADGAAYDPAARRWRGLPKAPIGPRIGHQAVWTGTEMVVWGGFDQCCPVDSVLHDPAGAAYDPGSDRWRRIGAVPAPMSGDDGTAVTMTDGGRPVIWRDGHLAAYDAGSNAWSEVAGMPPEPSPGNPPLSTTTADPFALAVSVDREVFTWTGPSGALLGLAWRSPDGSWRRTAPLDGQSGASITAGGPGRIYAAAGQSARVLEYRIADDRWEELPLPPISTRSAAVLVWTGNELLFWGGIGDEGPEMDGAAWRPAA